METKIINIKAHNYPEVIEILNKKFNVNNILNKERKFIHFEGNNFVYRYKILVVVRKQLLMCEQCGYPIEGKIAWHNRKRVCQFCFKTLTKGYHK